MTDSPVAAANARTMWKREIPPIAEMPSRVNSSARWLSINQSAFWAGFMDNGLRPKHPHHDRFAGAPFDSPCARVGGREAEPGGVLLPLCGKYQPRRRWQRSI